MPFPYHHRYRWIDPEGVAPAAFEPATVEEARQWIIERNRDGQGILIAGSGRHWQLGNNPQPVSAILGLRRCNRVIEYSPADLTATFEAGCTLQQIEDTLAGAGQFLPFFPLLSPHSTIGGIASANLSGPWAGALGGCRDYLIGVEVLHPEGRLSHAGGKVVKNVAGYDLCKLYCGALGTLGILTRLTFKLRPRPTRSCTLLLCFDALEGALQQARQIRDRIFPAALEVLAAPPQSLSAAFPDAAKPYRLVAGLLDSESALEWKKDRILELQGGAPLLQDEAEAEFWRLWGQAFQPRGGQPDGQANLLISAPLGLFTEVTERLEELLSATSFSASFLHSSLSVPVGLQELPDQLKRFRQHWTGRPVFSILWRAPADVKQSVEVWDSPSDLRRLHAKLQRQFDPNGILNPGRL